MNPVRREVNLQGTESAKLLKTLTNQVLDDAAPIWVDLRYSRMDSSSLQQLIPWMQERPAVSICVGFTNIGFADICRALMKAHGDLDWVYEGRLCIGADSEGRATDILHADGFLQGRAVTLDEALPEIKGKLLETARIGAGTAADHNKLMHEMSVFRDGAVALRKATRDVNNWQTRLTDSCEVLVTHLTRMYLLKKYDLKKPSDLSELDRGRHKVVPMPPVFERGVEWDGVLYEPASQHLYLIEAKSALEIGHITAMGERMKRTVDFLKLCGSGELPLKAPAGADASVKRQFHYLAMLCNAWAPFAEAQQVFGVVGGIGFTQRMLDTASCDGRLCVLPKEDAYEIRPPSSGQLTSVAPPSGDGGSSEVVGDDTTIISQDELEDSVAEIESVGHLPLTARVI
jgi:hypothetical protein